MKLRHIVQRDGEKVTEITYRIQDDNGWSGPSVARTFGHLTMVEMAEWIEDQRRLTPPKAAKSND